MRLGYAGKNAAHNLSKCLVSDTSVDICMSTSDQCAQRKDASDLGLKGGAQALIVTRYELPRCFSAAAAFTLPHASVSYSLYRFTAIPGTTAPMGANAQSGRSPQNSDGGCRSRGKNGHPWSGHCRPANRGLRR